jgi:hypothetical protein
MEFVAPSLNYMERQFCSYQQFNTVTLHVSVERVAIILGIEEEPE